MLKDIRGLRIIIISPMMSIHQDNNLHSEDMIERIVHNLNLLSEMIADDP